MRIDQASVVERERLFGGDRGYLAIDGDEVFGTIGWRVADTERGVVFFAHSLGVWPGCAADVGARLIASVREDARTMGFRHIHFTVEAPHLDLMALIGSKRVKVQMAYLTVETGLRDF